MSKPGTRFGRVSATWVAPAVTCSAGGRRYSAAWLGLGGLHTTATALEQIGTEADCAGGKGYYTAWYELVPAAPIQLQAHHPPRRHDLGQRDRLGPHR